MQVALLKAGWHGLLWWQWIELPAIFVAAWIFGKVAGWFTDRLVAKLTNKRPQAPLIVRRLGAPANFAFAVLAVFVFAPDLELKPSAEAFVGRVLRAGFLIALFWAIFRFVDVGEDRLLDLPSAKANPAARSLVPLATKGAKIVVFAMALIAALSELGYPVTSLVAGLGISGVALALAAQKTVENLFGSVSIGVDQPFRVGDFIHVEEVRGTVESIGLRSTRVRTLDRTVVTIPNGKLADLRIESFSHRDRIRLATTIGLAHETSAAAVRAVLAGCDEALRKQPKVYAPGIYVHLTKIAETGLEIEITATFDANDDEFASIRESVLLAFLDTIERAGAKLAYPTRIVRNATAGAEKVRPVVENVPDGESKA